MSPKRARGSFGVTSGDFGGDTPWAAPGGEKIPNLGSSKNLQKCPKRPKRAAGSELRLKKIPKRITQKTPKNHRKSDFCSIKKNKKPPKNPKNSDFCGIKTPKNRQKIPKNSDFLRHKKAQKKAPKNPKKSDFCGIINPKKGQKIPPKLGFLRHKKTQKTPKKPQKLGFLRHVGDLRKARGGSAGPGQLRGKSWRAEVVKRVYGPMKWGNFDFL